MKFRYIWKVLFPFQNKRLCTFLDFFPQFFQKKVLNWIHREEGWLLAYFWLLNTMLFLNWFESQRLFSFQNLSLTYLCYIRRWMSILWIPQPPNRNVYPFPQRSHSINTTDYKQSITLAVGNMELLGQKLRSWLPSYHSKPCWVDQMPSHSHFHTLQVIWVLLGSQIPELGAQIMQRNIPTPFNILCYPVLSSKKLQMAVLLPLK